MADKEIQASDEEMERFNISQDEKCVLAKKEKLNDLMNKISFALKDATLAQGFEIICKRISELESDLKVARNDRKYLEIEVGKGLREYIKDCPYSALKNFADAKIVDENEQLKDVNEAAKQELIEARYRYSELEKENEDFKKNLARYSAKIYEQEAQIEKMKRCNNCEFEDYEKYHGENCNFGNYKTCGNWELKK